ncbi:hypothetical protein [Sandarakinorhabdus sp. DWP1-3-1]|uniref:hypothetical protein n=1 Tax=Sandarakinorhabdus sp. DWP1-3-1 TaxID=2804627 RepID=UPI003CFA9A5A
MRIAWGQDMADCGFDLPPRFGVAERRLAGQAVAAWRAAGGAAIAGFEANSLVLAGEPAGPVVTQCGAAVAEAFGLEPGMALAGRPGLAAALCDAAGGGDRQPVPIEARLPGLAGSTILVRGVMLPLVDGARPPAGGDAVQVVMNWREILGRAATARLRHEIGLILAERPAKSARIDPFSRNTAG